MSAPDITRRLFQPDKRYSGVVRLQGAVLLDSDENEREAIDAHDERMVINDAVGANGTPNDGFKIAGITSKGGNAFDLKILAGSYFLGGQRFEAPAQFGLHSQPDWIGAGPVAPWPDHTTDKKFFVWLEGHEQVVSAREDSELLEAALNGVETSARSRAMTRVRITPTPRDNCIDALKDVVDGLTAAGGVYDPTTGTVSGAAKMKIGFVNGGPSDDLCTPAAQGGYLGADNETIRVQVTAPGQFVWGVSNAAPLYRVQLSKGAGGKYTKVAMLTPPWDQVAQPKAGDVVEFLTWEAMLPNREKVAVEDGVFSRVSASFSTANGTFEIDDNDAEIKPLVDWLGASPGGVDFYNSDDDAPAYIYMRVWRGANFALGQKQLAMAPGGVVLGQTGLKVTFDGPGRRGDYYVFSVRPHTPELIVPWAFKAPGGAPPTGPKRTLAALAFIDFNEDGPDGNPPLIEDCRRRFRPLSHASSCCEITVGDGVHSHGDFTSIQAAVDALPVEGGKVCVLKGVYEQVVDITKRKFITIEGCGDLTRIELDEKDQRSVFAIRDSHRITVRNLAITALHDVAVTVSTGQVGCADIVLEKLSVMVRDAPAVMAAPVDGFTLRDCDIGFETLLKRVTDVFDPVKPGTLPGVVVGGDRLTIEDNRIRCEAEDILLRPFGGVHILSGSRTVRILNNRLYRLGGMGIALGSYRFIDDPKKADSSVIGAAGDGRQSYGQYFKLDLVFYFYYPQIWYASTDDGCGEVIIIWWPPYVDPKTWEVDCGDPIEDIDIVGNEIVDTGLSGISVLRFFDQEVLPGMIAIERLTVRDNRIERAARTQLPVLKGSLLIHAGYGGITLAQVDGAVFDGNTISGCGPNRYDPVCGIYVLRGRDLVFTHNRIVESGGTPIQTDPVRFGQRGGVVIVLVSAPLIQHRAMGGVFKKLGIQPRFPRGAGALRFTDNVVVQPDGRALSVIADGPVMACNNELVSRGYTVLFKTIPNSLNLRRVDNDESFAESGAESGAAGGEAEGLAGGEELADGETLNLFLMRIGGSVVSIASLPAGVDRLLDDRGAGDAEAQKRARQYVADLLLYRGEVMCNDNRIVGDGLNELPDYAICGVSIFGADNASFCDNQYEAALSEEDLMLFAHVIVISSDSARVNDNTVRHTVTAGEKDDRFPAPINDFTAGVSGGQEDYDPVNQFSILTITRVSSIMQNQVSGYTWAFADRTYRLFNLQLFS